MSNIKQLIEKYSNLMMGILISFLLLFLRLVIQPIISVNNGQGWDGALYYNMATDIHAVVSLPFRLRIGLPLMVHYLPISNTLYKFELINLIFGVIFSITCYVGIAKYSKFTFTKIIAWLLICATGVSPIVLSIWYPTNSDTIANFLFLIVLILSLSKNKSPVLFFGLFAIGTIFRENFPIYLCIILFQLLIVPANSISSFLRSNFRSNSKVIKNILSAFIGSLLGFYILFAVTGVSPFEGKDQVFLNTLINQNLIKVLAALINVYGSLFVFIIMSSIITKRSFLSLGIINKSQFLLSIFILTIISLGGGSNTERFFYWGLIIMVFNSLPVIDNVALYCKPLYTTIAVVFIFIFQRILLPITPEGIAKCDVYNYLFGNSTFIGHWIQICSNLDSLYLILFYFLFIGIFGLLIFLSHLSVINLKDE